MYCGATFRSAGNEANLARIGVWNNVAPMVDQGPPNRSQIDALLRFLPSFKRQGFWFERVVWESGQVSYVEKSPEAEMFLRALRDNGWVVPTGGRSWSKEAEKRMGDSSRVERADLLTLRRLFSSWIQRDKMLPGHLGALYERGDLTAALERLQTLSQSSSSGRGSDARASRTLRS